MADLSERIAAELENIDGTNRGQAHCPDDPLGSRIFMFRHLRSVPRSGN